MTILLVVAIAVLFGLGAWLVMDDDMMRVVLGTALLGHAAVLLLVGTRPSGTPPVLADGADPAAFADPVPQALALTAIVIAFGVTALLLAITGHRPQDGTGAGDVDPDPAGDRTGVDA